MNSQEVFRIYEDNKLRDIVRFIRYTRVYLAAGSALLMHSFSVLLGIELPLLLEISAFFTVYGAYALNRKTDIEEDKVNMEYGSTELAEKIFYSGLLALATATVSAFLVKPLLVAAIALLVSMLVIYSAPILPGYLGYRRLKQVPFVKNLTIASAWGLFFALFLGIPSKFSTGEGILAMFLFIFARIFIGSVVPDINDMEGDRSVGVHTIPVLYGVRKTKTLLFVVNTAITLIFYGFIIINVFSWAAVYPATVNLIGFPIIYYTTRDNADVMTTLSEINDQYGFTVLLYLGTFLM